jgi:hypothetical protein
MPAWDDWSRRRGTLRHGESVHGDLASFTVSSLVPGQLQRVFVVMTLAMRRRSPRGLGP